MSDNSAIGWTTATWNVSTGCSDASDGCKNCYARTLIDTRLSVNPKSVRFGHPFSEVMLHPERLDQPLRWKRPRTIFVDSLSDLFHVEIPDEYIERVFDSMAAASWHTFQVLTKRAERLERFFRNRIVPPNVWLGVSVENEHALWRIRHLSRVDASVCFVSAEPLIGRLPNLRAHLSRVDWIIVGGESGPGARPCELEWFREILVEADAATTLVFVKQLGSVLAHELKLSGKGANPAEWPADLQRQDMPRHAGMVTAELQNPRKRATG